jgi:hypothetical protein
MNEKNRETPRSPSSIRFLKLCNSQEDCPFKSVSKASIGRHIGCMLNRNWNGHYSTILRLGHRNLVRPIPCPFGIRNRLPAQHKVLEAEVRSHAHRLNRLIQNI